MDTIKNNIINIIHILSESLKTNCATIESFKQLSRELTYKTLCLQKRI